MTQPSPYVPAFSFTGYQRANRLLPLPGDKVDANNILIRNTIDQVLDNLELIQRDDGEVANRTIGFDQLKPEVSLGIQPTELWETATAYAVGDTVFNDNTLYRCIVTHTSGVFATDLSAAKWVLVVDFTTFFSTNKASQAQAEAGLSNDVWMTPLRTTQVEYTATGGSVARNLADWFQGTSRGDERPPASDMWADFGTPQQHRWTGRFLFGQAAKQHGSYWVGPNGGPTVDTDNFTWLSTEVQAAFVERGAQMVVVTEPGGGGYAATFAARTSDAGLIPSNPGGGALDSIAVSAVAYSDDAVRTNFTGLKVKSWTYYGEAIQGIDCGIANAMELDVVSFDVGKTIDLGPYGFTGSGQPTMGIWLAAGGAKSGVLADATVGYALVNNLAKFTVGMCMRDNSLTLDGGGFMRAIDLPAKAYLQWHHNTTLAQFCGITSSCTNNTGLAVLDFSDNGPVFKTTAALAEVFRVNIASAAAVNGFIFNTAESGTGVSMLAYSATDGHVSLTVRPRGGGTAVYQSGDGTITGLAVNNTGIKFFGPTPVAQSTGWGVATGTAERTTFATYTAPDISAAPTESEVQGIADHVQILSRRLKALIDDLHATAGYGLLAT